MKKFTSFIVLTIISTMLNTVKAQWNTSGSDIYNSNAGNVGVGTDLLVSFSKAMDPGSLSSTTLLLRARQAERRVSEMLGTAVQEKESAEQARGTEARLRLKAEAEEEKA